jgi:hypothetical protein
VQTKTKSTRANRKKDFFISEPTSRGFLKESLVLAVVVFQPVRALEAEEDANQNQGCNFNASVSLLHAKEKIVTAWV